MNILLIIIDTLRPDHLSFNGYNRHTTPNIDLLTKESTSFLNAYCPLPRTDPTIASIMSSVYPHIHGVRLVHNNNPEMSLSTLPEILKSHGYTTIFMGGAGTYSPLIQKGFDKFNLTSWKIRNKIKRSIYKIFNPSNFLGVTEQYTNIAIELIKKAPDKRFFLCIHYEDLHWPYDVPKPFEHMFDPNYKGSHDFNTLKHGKFSRGDLIFGHYKLPEEELQHAIAHYDGGINYIDKQVGRLLDFIKKQGLDNDALVILTSDHGENFGEHSFYFQHGASLYEPSLKAPLIFKHPKLVPKEKIITHRVQNLDIMPTILDILKIPVLDKIDGKSLLPLIEGKAEKVRDFIFAESIEEHFKENKRVFFSGVKGKWKAMIVNNWKIIYMPHPEEDIFELYNLEDDPNETNNLIDKEEQIALDMKKKILNFLKQQSNEGNVNVEDLTEKSKKLLRKLGYID